MPHTRILSPDKAPKEVNTVKFALKCFRDPQALTETDYESLRQHGLNQSEIMEIIAVAAFAVYAKIMADATAMEADEMFDNAMKLLKKRLVAIRFYDQRSTKPTKSQVAPAGGTMRNDRF